MGEGQDHTESTLCIYLALLNVTSLEKDMIDHVIYKSIPAPSTYLSPFP